MSKIGETIGGALVKAANALSNASKSSSGSTTKKKTVNVNPDGKAPSGLNVGDDVVTAGGTYRITGVNNDGTYQSSKLGAGSEWTYNPDSNSGGSRGTSTNYGTYADDSQALLNSQKKYAAQQYRTAEEKALREYGNQLKALPEQYNAMRTQASVASQQNARNFAEYMANRGLTNSGASAQGELSRQSNLNNALANYNLSQQKAAENINQNIANTKSDYANQLALANMNLENQYYNNMLNYNENQRQMIDALRQQSLNQYANDYQAQINNLLAQGYSPNSREVLELEALRGQKVANQQAQREANALQLLQNYGVTGNNINLIKQMTGLADQEIYDIAQQAIRTNQLNMTNAELSVLANQLGIGANYGVGDYGYLYTPRVSTTGGSGNGTNGSQYNPQGTFKKSDLKTFTDNMYTEGYEPERIAAGALYYSNNPADIAYALEGKGVNAEAIMKAGYANGYYDTQEGLNYLLNVAEAVRKEKLSQEYVDKLVKYGMQ